MSTRAQHESKKSRQLCERCRNRKARFEYRCAVRADRNHPPSLLELRRASTPCFECYRSERERRRARALAAVEPQPIRSSFRDRPPLSAREIAHRRTMIAHLRRHASADTR